MCRSPRRVVVFNERQRKHTVMYANNSDHFRFGCLGQDLESDCGTSRSFLVFVNTFENTETKQNTRLYSISK